ncbi:hypothetical protein AB6T38_10775 [Aliiglaciecola sp. SL4]|uniref:hypothetical protein n=1 Tax=Aliiglaciecola sp. SL4 TaxID=3239806 RepID=UPI00355B6B4B
MGVTLAAQLVSKLAISSTVDTFVGIVGALGGLYGTPLGAKVYSINSNIDQIVCSIGVCSEGEYIAV